MKYRISIEKYKEVNNIKRINTLNEGLSHYVTPLGLDSDIILSRVI